MWKSGKQIVNCCYCFREVLVCATSILSRLSLSGKSFSKCEKGGIHHIITQPLIQKLWKTKTKMKTFFYKVRWIWTDRSPLLLTAVALLSLTSVIAQRSEVQERPGSLPDMGNDENRRPPDFASNPFPNQFPGLDFQDPFRTNAFRTTEDPLRTTQGTTTPTPFRRTQNEINRFQNKEPVLASFPDAPFNPNPGKFEILNWYV